MDDVAVGRLFRAIRIKRGWRQADVARRVGTSISQISRAETGQLGQLRVADLRAIAAVLEVRLSFAPSWRGGDADRLVNAGHVALQTRVVESLPRDWQAAVEATFAVRGERGSIDVLAWHPARRALLVIEVKTELADPGMLAAQVDRYRRVAPVVARERGWGAVTVIGVWVVIAESSMNRRRLGRAARLLRAALPEGFRAVRPWLRDPASPLAALSFLPYSPGRGAVRPPTAVRRVTRRDAAARAAEKLPSSQPQGTGSKPVARLPWGGNQARSKG